MRSSNVTSSSFRDPDSNIDDKLVRTLSESYLYHYEKYVSSGLHRELQVLVVPHTRTSHNTLVPEKIPFISYPYEWCFSMLKDAAIITLRIQLSALDYGMNLKDASAYNIQWYKGKMIHIDTASFEEYKPDTPWKAFGQFLKHFLYPLLLMQKDPQLGKLQEAFIDGMPPRLTSRVVSRFKHIKYVHLPAILERLPDVNVSMNISIQQQKGMLQKLLVFVQQLKTPKAKDLWEGYRSTVDWVEKKEVVSDILIQLPKDSLWDLGSNDGLYSRLARTLNYYPVIAMDSSHSSTEVCYQKHGREVLPLVTDLTNPSPSTGWMNHERMSLIERGPSTTILALALIHHLIIGNNCTSQMVAELFNKVCRQYLVVEMITPDDIQVQEMFKTKPNMRDRYDLDVLQKALSVYFNVERNITISPTRYLQVGRKKCSY